METVKSHLKHCFFLFYCTRPSLLIKYLINFLGQRLTKNIYIVFICSKLHFLFFFYRNQVIFGIRSVTKGLERGILSLVLVCRSAQPSYLTTHLISLLATRKASGASISDLSATLSPRLCLTSVLAVGFLKTADHADVESFVCETRSRLPKITLPWLHFKVKDNVNTPGLPLPKKGSFIGTRICVNKSTSKRKKSVKRVDKKGAKRRKVD